MTGLDSHCGPGKCCICNMEGYCLSLRDDLFVLAPKWEIENRLKYGKHYQVYEIALMKKTLDDIEQEERETKLKEKESMGNKEKTYKQGLEEAWEIARNVLLGPSNGGYTPREHVEIFKMSYIDVMRDLSIHEVKEKIAAYEAEQAKPKLGDVVKIDNKGEFLFLGEGREYYYVLDPSDNDGIPHQFVKKYVEKMEKTGKHFDIQSMLDEIG